MTLSDPFVRRIALAKILGVLIGLFAFYMISQHAPNAPEVLPYAFVALYLTVGGMVGAMGYYDAVPIFGFRLHPAVRGGMIGLWLSFVAYLFSWGAIGPAFEGYLGLPPALTHPVWMMIDGALVGALIDCVVSLIYGRVQHPRLNTQSS